MYIKSLKINPNDIAVKNALNEDSEKSLEILEQK
jgi:hypothetical protein